ncbi:hypothetical protein [Candidatus Poriferisodalis sp.]|uniref:hypothetical protein n=1 Tax=Candidatus Poriferisodalis sp. TaxID=3101277 RepID=UPI003B02C298
MTSQQTEEPAEGSAVPSSNPLYRRSAYEHRGRVAPIDGILRVSAPHEWLVLLALAAMIVAAVVWSFAGRLESGVSGPCSLRPAGERHTVTATVSGVVTEVLARPGHRLASGAPLLRVTSPEVSLAAELARVRAAALGAQHPDSADAVAARAEAEALADVEASGTLVRTPFRGTLVSSAPRLGDTLMLGAPIAEIHQAADGPPQATIFLTGVDAARARPGMKVSVGWTQRSSSDSVLSDAAVTEVNAAAPVLGSPGAEFSAGATADATVIAEFAQPLADAPALGSGTDAALGCTARIVTASRRPIELLIGRR